MSFHEAAFRYTELVTKPPGKNPSKQNKGYVCGSNTYLCKRLLGPCMPVSKLNALSAPHLVCFSYHCKGLDWSAPPKFFSHRLQAKVFFKRTCVNCQHVSQLASHLQEHRLEKELHKAQELTTSCLQIMVSPSKLSQDDCSQNNSTFSESPARR